MENDNEAHPIPAKVVIDLADPCTNIRIFKLNQTLEVRLETNHVHTLFEVDTIGVLGKYSASGRIVTFSP